MPALYVHTSRATGTTLTADIYNTDHQNHVTNGDAAGLGGYSANATQMQATTDPGEVSSENLAASIADEIERLRFIIKEMKNTAQWYSSTFTRVESLHPFQFATAGAVNDGAAWNDAIATTNYFWWRVPDAYASGDLTVSVNRRGAAAGTAVMRYSTSRYRDATAVSGISTGVNVDFTPGDTNIHTLTFTVAAASFTVGDVIRIDVFRSGTDGGDTMTTAVGFDGAFVSYTAYAGRP